MLSWLFARLYDPLLRRTEEACLGEWRRRLIEAVGGVVLEVGSGTGLNLPHYSQGVEHLILTEPDKNMRKQLLRRVPRAVTRTSVCAGAAEQLPVRSDCVDTVVSTLVLCSVRDPFQSLAEIHRVLKPGGQLVFLEHVRSRESEATRRWQVRIEPVWKHVAGNCHLTRCTDEWIEQSGFEMVKLEREKMWHAPRIVRSCVLGIAVKRGAGPDA